MKVLFFENGEQGRLVEINGENVEREVEELLGGKAEQEQLNSTLTLAVRKNGEQKGLPRQYKRVRPWRTDKWVYGNAVVFRAHRNRAEDMTEEDARETNLYISMEGGQGK